MKMPTMFVDKDVVRLYVSVQNHMPMHDIKSSQ